MLQCGILADNTRGANMFQYEAASCTVAVYLGRPQEYQDGQAQLNNVFISTAQRNRAGAGPG